MNSEATLLFDFGGTLNSNGDHWGALFVEMMGDWFPESSVKEREDAFIASERRLGSEGLKEEGMAETIRRQVAYQIEAAGVDVDVEEVTRNLIVRTEDRLQQVRELLRMLNPRYKIGIVSNYYGNLDAICREAGLTEFLGTIVDSAVVGVRKPNPEIWEIGLARLSADPSTTIVIGDSWSNDIEPGAKLGCRTVWYRGKEWRPARAEWSATHEIRSLDDLTAILLRNPQENVVL